MILAFRPLGERTIRFITHDGVKSISHQRFHTKMQINPTIAIDAQLLN